MDLKCSDEEDVFYEKAKVDKSLLVMITDLTPGQRFEDSGFIHGGGLVYDIDSVSLTDCKMTEVGEKDGINCRIHTVSFYLQIGLFASIDKEPIV